MQFIEAAHIRILSCHSYITAASHGLELEGWRLTLRLSFVPLILLRGVAFNTKSGIGGVISLLGGDTLRDLRWFGPRS